MAEDKEKSGAPDDVENADEKPAAGEKDAKPPKDKKFASENRKKDYSKDEDLEEELADTYRAVVKGFDDKSDQNLTLEDNWDIYNCELNSNQSYQGDSEIYVPIVRDAIEARCTRFSNQIFPQSGRYIDVVAEGDTIPWDIMSILNSYVEAAKLKSIVIPALMREGDCSGQYSLMVEWCEKERHIIEKSQKPVAVSELGNADPDEEKYEDRETKTVKEGRPDVVVLDARNLVVLPATVDEVDDAEIVGVAMWMSKGRVKKLKKNGTFDEDAADALLANFESAPSASTTQPDSEKKALNQAGVKSDSSGSKRALIYKVWKELEIGEDGEKRLCEMYFAGENNCLSCKRVPFWNDKVPVISKPVIKVPGSFWGKAPVTAVAPLQYQANDAVNIGMDSAKYALLPIVMTDPAKNPRIGSMVIAQAAIWETSPNDTKFVNFPPLYKDALSIVSACKEQIMQSLGVNPAMMPQGNVGKKPTQAQAAQEQQVALESTANVVTILEEGVLNDLAKWFYDLDYQYRTESLTLQKFGMLGYQANLEQVPLIQAGAHYVFRWNGTEANKSTQQVQQMIAAMNVLRGIPPQLMNGRKIDLTPVIDHLAGVAFGPRLAPKVIIDQRHMLSMPPEMENTLMLQGFPMHISPEDNDMEHIQKHQEAARADTHGLIHPHTMEHILALKQKQAQAMGAQQPQQGGQPGAPGGAGPGQPGMPRPGAQPGMPRAQQPPGAVHQDQMPMAMPRKSMM